MVLFPGKGRWIKICSNRFWGRGFVFNAASCSAKASHDAMAYSKPCHTYLGDMLRQSEPPARKPERPFRCLQSAPVPLKNTGENRKLPAGVNTRVTATLCFLDRASDCRFASKGSLHWPHNNPLSLRESSRSPAGLPSLHSCIFAEWCRLPWQFAAVLNPCHFESLLNDSPLLSPHQKNIVSRVSAGDFHKTKSKTAFKSKRFE